MNWTAVIIAGAASFFSMLGGYVAVRMTLAELREHVRGIDDRMQRHSNRLNRLEDAYFKAD